MLAVFWRGTNPMPSSPSEEAEADVADAAGGAGRGVLAAVSAAILLQTRSDVS